MKKFYMFTKTTAEDRRKELLDFVTKYNSKYNSYDSVIIWIKNIRNFQIMNSDGFEFADEETSKDPLNWGHGGLFKYIKTYHILANDNLDLGKL